jgi:AraC-like DNA-binding protein
MPSDPAPVTMRLRLCAVLLGAALLVSLCSPAAAGAAAVETLKKKAVKPAKPVFSVSAAESPAEKPSPQASQKSKIPASTPDSAVKTVGQDTLARTAQTAAARDSASPASPPPKPIAQPVAPPAPKRSADTIAKAPAVPVVKSPAAAAVPLTKHSSPAHSRLLRIMIFLGSITVIAGAFRFVRKQRASPRFLTTTRLSVMDKEVQRACRYIEKNFADPGLSLERICKDLVTGEAFIEALMERDLGVSVGDFLAHVRINHAKRILSKDPSAAGESVARDTGFENDVAFRACFRKLTGVAFEAYSQRKGTGADA